MDLAPICLFAYKRKNELSKTIDSLKNNKLHRNTDLIIFSDGPKTTEDEEKVLHIRRFIKSIIGFKSISIIESKFNKGLAQSIVDGVSYVLKSHKSVIVLEDDITVTSHFLEFMNFNLNKYERNENIISISGFSPYIDGISTETYLHTRPFPWGWATWKSKWHLNDLNIDDIRNNLSNKEFRRNFKNQCGGDIVKMLSDSLNGLNSSWYVKWVYYHFIYNKYSLFPKYSMSITDGYGEDATHCKSINTYHTVIYQDSIERKVDSEAEVLNNEQNIDFLKYFSFKYKLKFRLKLLLSKEGRVMILNEIKNRLLK